MLREVVTAGVVAACALLSACTPTPEDAAVAPGATAAGPSPAPTLPAETSASASPTAEFATDAAYSVAPPADGDGPAPVQVDVTRWVVSDAGVVEVGAVVQGVSETTGACTLTLSRGDEVREATGPGAASPSHTSCGEGLAVDASALATGTWDVVVAYASADYTGASAAKEIEIP